ncbi:hypothetical protein JFV30_07235 [Pseudomonas sp. TH32]|uniref:hypothetical protein n=1 Tax=Pseudomonas sp. TH32 TaxID=2796397 RepID=UPI00191233C9|nr:hypothetical protein [Pseudomonas sp. TH32]MBK5436654.1 hypothetical protein [Pseudomonas sp. TH32]
MDDEGDFKKARGFLLTYSALVLALWYFGADLTQFKLMGNEIKLHQRTESVWLVLAALNVYFWFRFYQHLPGDGLNFDSEMRRLYAHSLQNLAKMVGRKGLQRALLQHVGSRGLSPVEVEVMSIKTQVGQFPSRWNNIASGAKEALKSRFNPARYQVAVHLLADYKFRSTDSWTKDVTSFTHIHTLGPCFTWPVKAFTVVRGAFVTPWFTDHVMPLVLGGVSTGFALWKWCDMNFFTTTLPHLAQSCAGVTH